MDWGFYRRGFGGKGFEKNGLNLGGMLGAVGFGG